MLTKRDYLSYYILIQVTYALPTILLLFSAYVKRREHYRQIILMAVLRLSMWRKDTAIS